MTVHVLLPVETAEKIRRLREKSIARCLTPCFSASVPDAPDPDKEILGVRIDRALKKRVERAASAKGMTITDFVREILHKETFHITLSAKDYEDIATKVRKAEAKLSDRKP